jgi:hypothetical protein
MKQQINCNHHLNDLYRVLQGNSNLYIEKNTILNIYRPPKVFYLSSVIAMLPLATSMTHTEISPHITITTNPHLSP